MAARLAAERRDHHDIAHLQELAFDNSAEDDTYLSTSSDFHRLIAELAGNGVISLFCQSLGEVFHARVKGNLFPAGKARREVVNTHAAIATAVIEGDAVTAQRLM